MFYCKKKITTKSKSTPIAILHAFAQKPQLLQNSLRVIVDHCRIIINRRDQSPVIPSGFVLKIRLLEDHLQIPVDALMANLAFVQLAALMAISLSADIIEDRQVSLGDPVFISGSGNSRPIFHFQHSCQAHQ